VFGFPDRNITVRRHLSTWLLAFFIISYGPLNGLALCFGADGHVEVETAHNGQCGPLSQESPQHSGPTLLSGSSVGSSDNHCGPCIDIPISITSADEELNPAFGTFHQLKAPLDAKVSFDRELFDLGSAGNADTSYRHVINSTLLSIRTIVLII